MLYIDKQGLLSYIDGLGCNRINKYHWNHAFSCNVEIQWFLVSELHFPNSGRHVCKEEKTEYWLPPREISRPISNSRCLQRQERKTVSISILQTRTNIDIRG